MEPKTKKEKKKLKKNFTLKRTELSMKRREIDNGTLVQVIPPHRTFEFPLIYSWEKNIKHFKIQISTIIVIPHACSPYHQPSDHISKPTTPVGSTTIPPSLVTQNTTHVNHRPRWPHHQKKQTVKKPTQQPNIVHPRNTQKILPYYLYRIRNSRHAVASFFVKKKKI